MRSLGYKVNDVYEKVTKDELREGDVVIIPSAPETPMTVMFKDAKEARCVYFNIMGEAKVINIWYEALKRKVQR